MENIDALQAIERGEKPDQATLVRLKYEGLVDLADVTNNLSPGQEFIYVGFTVKGLSLLKQSKLELFTDEEREIIKAVVRRFLDQHEATSKRALLKQFRSPVTAALQRLGNLSVLQVANNTYPAETYLPKAIAFYHCGDSAALAFARKSTGVVLRVLRDLLDRDLEGEANDQRQFTPAEVVNAARAIDSSVEPNMIFTGLYLAQEFGIFPASQRDAQQVGIVYFSLSEHIYDASQMDWDEHIRRANVSVATTWEQNQSESSGDTLPPYSAIGLEDYAVELDNRKIFLGHGRNTLWARVQIYLKDELRLNVEAWESNSRTGLHSVDVLKGILDSCTFAVIVATGEDATASGGVRARQNVVHEIGLFQGRVGFEKVALLQQRGIEELSNLAGLQVILFDEGQIEATFYELGRMLRREGIIP